MHFLVYVLGEDPEGQLGPFGQENEEFFEFRAEASEEQLIEKWNTRTVTVRLLDDGNIEKKIYHLSFHQEGPEPHTVEVSLKRVYDSLEHFIKDLYGYCKENGDYGYRSNPWAIWDWYEIGGRWSGHIINTKGEKVDQCKIKEIDVEATWQEHVDYVTLHWRDRHNHDGLTLEEKLAEDRKNNFLVPCHMIVHGELWSNDGTRWPAGVAQLMKEAGGDCLLTVVDCHN
jgi:hypothetical protein